MAGNDYLISKLKKFEEQIKQDTLADNIIYAKQDRKYTNVSINKEELLLDVEVIKS